MDAPRINKWLKPLSALYGVGVRLRNHLFDKNVLISNSFDIPIVCVGNITIGGTGKTPHVEYLIRLLHPRYRIAVVSRGYKRKTKGMIVATEGSTAWDIGDEPRQIKRKYPDLTVIVDADRSRAIGYLCDLAEEQRPQLIILDDGFQHRKVKADLNIVLTDYNRILTKDYLLPAGRLREPAGSIQRADMVILTKCPDDLAPIDLRAAKRDLALYPHQKLFFSKFLYGQGLKPLFSDQSPSAEVRSALAIAGIASPKLFFREIRTRFPSGTDRIYPDHHEFTDREICLLIQDWHELRRKDANAIVVCTEKDAMRLALRQSSFPQEMQERFYYLPVEVKLMFDQEKVFVDRLLGVIQHKK